MQRELKFCVNQLIIDKNNPTITDFDQIGEDQLEKSSIKLDENKVEEVLSVKKSKRLVLKQRFVCLYFEEGDKYPYPEKVVSNNLEETPNPRPKDQIELNNQLFVLIDTSTSRIFVSDQRKKLLLVAWLKDKIGKEVYMKPLINQSDFVQKIKSLSEVCFTVEPNLLNSYNKGTLSTALVEDIFGFDAYEASIRLMYKNGNITQKIQDKLNALIGRKDDFKNITIIGRTNDNFESVFDMTNIVSKISVNINVDNNNQKIDCQTVFDTLIAQIE